ncbi:uncharacterized protein LOC131536051 [Onychostoma macrolepis]|uniref:uncharacterized protein LOC131536051 n=1 Tax=Onychostoma macrolepis TaxID=369639 RepID=UPI00272B9D16|nr:uncharacterized protein LOC131536051 [Onychostoma macrolepis]
MADSIEERPSLTGDGHDLASPAGAVEHSCFEPQWEPLQLPVRALSVSASCLEFGPNDCKVVLRQKGQVFTLLALPAADGEQDSNLLCPVKALRVYFKHSSLFRKSEQLYVCFGGCSKGLPATKQRLSRMIVDAIALAYASEGLQCPMGVRAHTPGNGLLLVVAILAFILSAPRLGSQSRSRYDATLTKAGPPALYQLNTERKYFDGMDRKVRQWTYGRRDRNKQNKVILMMGETGAGKTTLINTMINHLLGVKFEDQEFYQITEEEKHEDQSQSQTSEITVYEVFVEENPTSLTIIDTPGYADTEGYEKDGQIAETLSRLFSVEDGILYIDAVCFVMKESQNRLSGKEFYIIHSVLSLFGRDIENNIMFLLTQSDGGPPTDALNAIKKAEIPCRRDEDNQHVYFLFNNRQKEERDEEYKHLDRSDWEMGEKSINRLLTLLEEKNRKSVQMTLDVLNKRRQLEARVSNLMERISEKELKTEELTQIQDALRQNRDKIEKCENFPFPVERVFKEKVPISPVRVWSWWYLWRENNLATSCSVCKETCHNEHGCWWVPFDKVESCEVMKNNYCTVCSGKCHYSEHKKEETKYVTKTVTMTFKELEQENKNSGEKPKITNHTNKYEDTKQERESNMKESENKQEIEEKLKNVLENNRKGKSDLLHEVYMTIMNLSEIALKADSASTLQHLDFLIPRLKEEGKDEWIRNLEDLRKAGEEPKNKKALDLVMDFTGKTFNQLMSFVTSKK